MKKTIEMAKDIKRSKSPLADVNLGSIPDHFICEPLKIKEVPQTKKND